MFGIGSTELLIIIVIAVIIIGPKQLPQVAKTMGKMFTQLKRATNDLRNAVDEEVYKSDEWRDVTNVKDSFESEIHSAQGSVKGYLESGLLDEKEIAEELRDEVQAMVTAKPKTAAKKSGAKKSGAKKTTTATAKKTGSAAKTTKKPVVTARAKTKAKPGKTKSA